VKVVQLLDVSGRVVDEVEVASDVAQVVLKLTPTLAVVKPEPEPESKGVTRIDKPKPKTKR